MAFLNPHDSIKRENPAPETDRGIHSASVANNQVALKFAEPSDSYTLKRNEFRDPVKGPGNSSSAHSNWRTVLQRALLIFSLLGWLSAATFAQSGPTPEHRIKAVFLYNFAQFVEWPATAFDNPTSPLIIGIVGTDPFGRFLDETVQGEMVHGRHIEVKRFKTPADIDRCHILFVSRSEEGNFNKIAPRIAGKPILTVGDSEGFARFGGMVRFYSENNKIRLRINLDAVRATRLNVSSKLLRVAEIVSSGKE